MDFTIRPHYIYLVNVCAKTSVLVVVLAMDIRYNGTTECDELGSGCDRWKPSMGQERSDDVANKNPNFGNDLAGCRIEGRHPVGVARLDGRIGVDSAVAIGASITAGDEAGSCKTSSRNASTLRRLCVRASITRYRPQPDSFMYAPPTAGL